MTPEGRVKLAIRTVLIAASAYHHMPVQNGMGKPTLDFTGCCEGIYYTIEAKAPGEQPTARQRNTMRSVIRSGGSVFLIDGPDSPDMRLLKDWLHDPKPGVIGGQVIEALSKTPTPEDVPL